MLIKLTDPRFSDVRNVLAIRKPRKYDHYNLKKINAYPYEERVEMLRNDFDLIKLLSPLRFNKNHEKERTTNSQSCEIQSNEFFRLTKTRHTKNSAEKRAQKYKSFSKAKIERKTLKNTILKVFTRSFRIGRQN